MPAQASRSSVVKRRRFLKVGGAASAGLMAGCMGDDNGSNGGNGTSVVGETNDEVTIQVVRPGEPNAVKSFLEPAIEKFEAEHSGINVEPIYQGWTGWLDRVYQQIAAGDQPHVFMLNDHLQLTMLDRGVPLQPLGDVLDNDVIENNVAYDMVSLNGENYIVPACTGSLIYYYRKDLFEEAGLDPESPPMETFDGLYNEVLPALDENVDAAPIGVPAHGNASSGLQAFWSIHYFAHADQGFLDEPNGTPTWDSPEGIAATQDWVNLAPYTQDEPLATGRGNLRPVLAQGDVAIHADGPWILPSLQEEFGDFEESPIGAMPLPTGPAGSGALCGFDGWCIAQDEHVDASAKLVNHLASLEVQAAHDQGYGCVPVRQDELEQEFFQSDPWSTLFESLEQAERRIYHDQSDAMTEDFFANAQAIWSGTKTVEEGLSDSVDPWR